MKSNSVNSSHQKGTSLIEAIIAIGVLAVAVPLVFGTMAETGETGMSAQAETRCTWIVPACVEEIQLAMQSKSTLLKDLRPGDSFPSGGGVTAISFTAEGKPLEAVSQGGYREGVRTNGIEPARFIASMSGETVDAIQGVKQNLLVKIVVEYPAAAPEHKRQKLEFYTRMP